MNNKILIGSIIAVAILILVSFTSVVGYNSVESDVKSSPLFNIRSSRAVDKEGKGFTTDYVGKGEESVLSIPKRDISNLYIKEVIEILKDMDDITYNEVIKRLHQNRAIRKSDIPIMMVKLHQLKNNPGKIKNELTGKTDSIRTFEGYCTLFYPNYPLMCFVVSLFFTLWFTIFAIILSLLSLNWPCTPD